MLTVVKENAHRAINKLLVGLFSFSLFLYCSSANAERASLIVDLKSGAVLHADHANRASYPASLTKLMTLYQIFESLDKRQISMQDAFVVSKNAAKQGGSRLGLKAGQRLTVEQMILALIVVSANDVAVAAAEAISGSETAFAERMNLRARLLGMKHSVFRNASGLPHPEQKTTARDLAVLATALYQRFPEYYPLFATQYFTYGKRKWRSHNHFLRNYAGAAGMKTGYTCSSGYNLVSTVARDREVLLGVILGEPTRSGRDQQMENLMDRVLTAGDKKNQRTTLNELRYHRDQGHEDMLNKTPLAAHCRSMGKAMLAKHP